MTEPGLARDKSNDAAPALDPAARCGPLSDRAIVQVAGPDRVAFLQGLVTSDVNRAGREGIVYAAILTPQGKYLADFLIVARPEALWLDIDAALADDLLKRLSLYKLRSKVELARIDLPVSAGIGPMPPGALADPRHPDMGWRLYGQALNQGAPIDWDARRVAALVPAAGRELVPGESFILEFGFERLGGVDFRKGCYVGQEVTARMHHKTSLRKGLAQVAIEGHAAEGAAVHGPDGRAAGVMGTVAGARGLAWLRLDRAEGGLVAQDARLTVIARAG